MNDYLDILNKFLDDQGIADLISDVARLRFLYSIDQYDSMIQFIKELSKKYLTEAAL